jgi:hypothetical protein
MNQSFSTPIIPNDYVMRISRDEMGGQRTVTVRQYNTNVPFDRAQIITGITTSRLVFGTEFGVVESYNLNNSEHNIRILCGLVGERNLVLLNQQSNRPDYYRIKNVLLATLMVEFSEGPSSKKIELLVYGGKQGNVELWNMLRNNFGIDAKEVVPRVFSDTGLRSLCERFFQRLYQININPWYKEGWGTIKAADFKSSRGQFIDPNVDRMKQILENKDILIESFRSVLAGQMMVPDLEDAYTIKFHILKDSGVSLDIPELTLPATKSDIAYETTLYDLAHQTYRRIIGDEELFEAPPEKPDAQQLSLFNET